MNKIYKITNSITTDAICKALSKELNEDYETIKKVVDYQFYIIKQIMQDSDNEKDILLNNLMRFKLKTKFKK